MIFKCKHEENARRWCRAVWSFMGAISRRQNQDTSASFIYNGCRGCRAVFLYNMRQSGPIMKRTTF